MRLTNGSPRRALFLVASALTFVGARPAQVCAQSRNPESKLQIELAVVSGPLSRKRKDIPQGDSLGSAKTGFGIDIAAVVPAQAPLWVALGMEYIRHATDEVWAANKLALLKFYVEPRFVFNTRGRIVPYVWGRIGYVHETQLQNLVDDAGFESQGNAVQTGPSFGLGGAIQAQINPHMRGSLSVGFHYTSLGDIDFDFDHIPSTALTMTGVTVRAGLALDFAPTGSAIRAFFR